MALQGRTSVGGGLARIAGSTWIHITHAWHVRSTTPRTHMRWLLRAQGRSDSHSRGTPASCSSRPDTHCAEAHPVSCAYYTPCPACCAIRVCELCLRNSARYVRFCCALAGFAIACRPHGVLRVRVALVVPPCSCWLRALGPAVCCERARCRNKVVPPCS